MCRNHWCFVLLRDVRSLQSWLPLSLSLQPTLRCRTTVLYHCAKTDCLRQLVSLTTARFCHTGSPSDLSLHSVLLLLPIPRVLILLRHFYPRTLLSTQVRHRHACRCVRCGECKAFLRLSSSDFRSVWLGAEKPCSTSYFQQLLQATPQK